MQMSNRNYHIDWRDKIPFIMGRLQHQTSILLYLLLCGSCPDLRTLQWAIIEKTTLFISWSNEKNYTILPHGLVILIKNYHFHFESSVSTDNILSEFRIRSFIRSYPHAVSLCLKSRLHHILFSFWILKYVTTGQRLNSISRYWKKALLRKLLISL